LFRRIKYEKSFEYYACCAYYCRHCTNCDSMYFLQ